MVVAGDVLFTVAGSIGLTYLVREGDLPACFAGYLARVRPNSRILAHYLAYWTESKHFTAQAHSLKVSSTIDNLSAGRLRSLRVVVPNLETQRRCVDFLDRKTEELDTLIARKRRLGELLYERRAALISHAVTRGLNTDVPMKSSSIPWFGMIPAHWPVVRLGYFASVLNGSTPSRGNSAYWCDGTIPWLASTKVNDDRVTSPSELITQTALRECSLALVPAGSVVIGLVGQGRTRGMAALLDIETTINQNMAAIIPRRRFMGRYLQYQLESIYTPIREYGRGANQAALNCELISDLRLPSPPPDEQAAIAHYLDAEMEAIRALVEGTRKSVDLLIEYRIALITAAMGGQIDMRTYRSQAS